MLTTKLEAVADSEISVPKSLEPNSENQFIGGYAEDVLEFMLGDAALKGLSTAQKLEKMMKTARYCRIPLIGKTRSNGCYCYSSGCREWCSVG